MCDVRLKSWRRFACEKVSCKLALFSKNGVGQEKESCRLLGVVIFKVVHKVEKGTVSATEESLRMLERAGPLFSDNCATEAGEGKVSPQGEASKRESRVFGQLISKSLPVDN